MKKVPEIYPAEIWVSKALGRISTIAEANPHMYAKSRARYRRIARSCAAIINLISDMLETDMLAQVDMTEENVQLSDTTDSQIAELDSIASDITDHVDRVKSFLPESTDSSSQTDKVDYKKVKAVYAKMFNHIAVSGTPYIVADSCAQFLHDWFSFRFLQHGKFWCNLTQLPIWIEDMVLLYGKYVENQQLVQLQQYMDKWYSKVAANDAECKFAVPYEAHELESECGAGNITLSGLVLWDILVDNGMIDRDYGDCGVHIATQGPIHRARTLNAQSASNYMPYDNFPEVLAQCNIL